MDMGTDLDHSKATVRIELMGLMLLSKSPDGGCKLGIVSCANHQLSMTIHKLTMTMEDEKPRLRSKLFMKLLPYENMTIRVENLDKPYAEFHETRGFDRKAKTKENAEDFRWVIDLENDEFLGGPINGIRRQRGVAPFFASMGPTFRINHGTFYTRKVHDFTFARVTRGPDQPASDRDAPLLGQVAEVVGIDINTGQGEAVILEGGDLGPKPIRLVAEPGISYVIEITNECTTPVSALESSDFVIYFDILDTGNKEFDLRQAVRNGDPLAGEALVINGVPSEFSLGQYPRVCNTVFLSRTGL